MIFADTYLDAHTQESYVIIHFLWLLRKSLAILDWFWHICYFQDVNIVYTYLLRKWDWFHKVYINTDCHGYLELNFIHSKHQRLIFGKQSTAYVKIFHPYIIFISFSSMRSFCNLVYLSKVRHKKNFKFVGFLFTDPNTHKHST